MNSGMSVFSLKTFLHSLITKEIKKYEEKHKARKEDSFKRRPSHKSRSKQNTLISGFPASKTRINHSKIINSDSILTTPKKTL